MRQGAGTGPKTRQISGLDVDYANYLAQKLGVKLQLVPTNPASRVPLLVSKKVDLVLANLLDNAVKFSPPGSSISVHVAREGEHAIVGVADAGPGIGVEDLPHLFERFCRGAQARAGEAPGFGLGLALSQAIVHAYGGSIEAQNRPQGGALFLMRLPASD